MRNHNNNHVSSQARNAAFDVRQQLDKLPPKFKSISELIDKYHVNRRSLEKAFKQEHGFRIKQYQVMKRLEYAKQLLQDGIPVKRVAVKCHYRSQSAFCRAFRKQFNMTPTDYLEL